MDKITDGLELAHSFEAECHHAVIGSVGHSRMVMLSTRHALRTGSHWWDVVFPGVSFS